MKRMLVAVASVVCLLAGFLLCMVPVYLLHEVAHLQGHLAGIDRLLRVQAVDLPPDHVTDRFLRREIGDGSCDDMAAVAQDGDPVA